VRGQRGQHGQRGRNGNRNNLNKPELLDLAASIPIEGRTGMTKAQLVTAISRASSR
jgi:hypothetical protein